MSLAGAVLDRRGSRSYSQTHTSDQSISGYVTFSHSGSGTGNLSNSAAGTFANGQYSLSSTVSNQAGQDSSSTSGSSTGTLTIAGSFSASSSGISSTGITGSYSYTGGGSATSSFSSGDSGSFTLYQAGSLSNGSQSLGSMLYAEDGTSNSSSVQTTSQSVSGTGYSAVSTYNYGESSSESSHEGQEGTYSNGSFNLSSFTANGTGTSSESFTQTSLTTATGGNVSSTYSGQSNSTSTLYGNGAFSGESSSFGSYGYNETTSSSTSYQETGTNSAYSSYTKTETSVGTFQTIQGGTSATGSYTQSNPSVSTYSFTGTPSGGGATQSYSGSTSRNAQATGTFGLGDGGRTQGRGGVRPVGMPGTGGPPDPNAAMDRIDDIDMPQGELFYGVEYDSGFLNMPRTLAKGDAAKELDKVMDRYKGPTGAFLTGGDDRGEFVNDLMDTTGTMVSTVADFIPGVGAAKAGAEAITGVDPITGRELSGWERAVAGLGAIPFAGAFKAGQKGASALKKGSKAAEAVKDASRVAHFGEDVCKVAKDGKGLGKTKNITGCFAAGTALLTPEGFRNIEDFEVGDYLISAAETNADSPLEAKRVEEVFRNTAPLVELHVRGQVIRTTAEHPFYVKGKGWLGARELREGDMLRSHDGEWVPVAGIWDTGEWATVYNLSIEDYHTFFLGGPEWGFSIWAHNANLDCAGHARRLRKNLKKAGQKITKSDRAAHVVPTGRWSQKSPRVQNAISNSQTILSDAGIDIDHAANGFPTKSRRHLGTHTGKFLLYLENELAPLAGNRAGIIAKLRDISGRLKSGAIRF